MRAGSQPLLGQEVAVRDRRPIILLCFFFIGAGSCITFNSVVMAVAYFREFLGGGVLAKITLAHNLALLLSMGGLIIAASRNPSLWVYHLTLRASFVFAIAFDVFIFHAALTQQPVVAPVMLPLVALNGIATGLVQGLGASLGGLFDPYSFAKGCGSMQLSGAGFGVLVPTLTQLALLPYEASVETTEQLRAAARLGAMLSTAIGAVVCILAVVAVGILRSSHVWATVAEQCKAGIDSACGPRPPENSAAAKNPAVDTIGKCINTGSKAVLWRRLNQLAAVMVAQVINEFSFVSLLLMAPALPVQGSGFWQHYLATVLLIISNVGSFSGRMVATTAAVGDDSGAERLGRHGRAVVLVLLVLVAPVPSVAAKMYTSYAHTHGDILSPMAPVAAFAAATTLSGFTIISLSQLSQRLCNHSMETPCEITAQFIWISLNVGALAGTILSLVTT